MGILNDLLGKVKNVESGLTTGETIGDVLLNYRDDIMDLQLYQLFSGKASNGEDIRPLYSEDLKPGGYFRSKETAMNYAAWKQEIPYPYQVNRNPDAPNLYINGRRGSCNILRARNCREIRSFDIRPYALELECRLARTRRI